MDSQDFYDEMMNNVRARAEVESEFTESAFLSEVAERLVEAEVVSSLTPVHFTGSGLKNRRLAISAYEFDDSDDSVALTVIDFEEGDSISRMAGAEAEKHFTAVERFVEEALNGIFQEGREESTEEYQLAEVLRRRSQGITRYRIYLLTNKALSGRAKDFPTGALNGTPVDYRPFGFQRGVMVGSRSQLGRPA